jgi:transcriptional regulator with XRE-family HTH domain
MAASSSPDPIDVHVGTRVRIRRKQLGLSQSALADALGLTFQQVQKYERGANRVSSSMLVRIARRLEVSIGYFFDGLPDLPGGEGDRPADIDALAAVIAVPAVRNIAGLSRERQNALQVLIEAMTKGE